MSEPSRPPLVEVEELAGLVDGHAPTVLDVRWDLADPHGHAEYLAGHIPGATYCDLDQDLAAPAGPRGRHPLPSAESFTEAMRRRGVSRERPVVVCDGGASMAAARGWWLLGYFGHPDVRVLNGGYAAWVEAGLAVEQGEVPPRRGDFTAEPGHLPVLAADEVLAFTRTGVLLDVRSPERFRGEHEPLDAVAGHIPGAMNMPAQRTVDEDGRLLSAARLQDRLAVEGVKPDDEVAAYCGSGVSAARTVLALEHAGVTAALYPGSWSEWTAEPDRPVATGEDPQPAG